MPKYYLYTESTDRVLAGPVSVCGLFAPEPLILPADDLAEWVDEAIKTKKLFFIHYYVWPDELNFKTLQRRVDSVCCRLFFQSETRATYHRLVKSVPHSYNYAIHYERCPAHYRIASYLCHQYRANLILTHYTKVHPEYSLTKHWGYRTALHLEEILHLGPRADFHHDQVRSVVSQYWLKQLLAGNPKYLMGDHPYWWGSSEFIDPTLIPHLLTPSGCKEHLDWLATAGDYPLTPTPALKNKEHLGKKTKEIRKRLRTRQALQKQRWLTTQKNSTGSGRLNPQT